MSSKNLQPSILAGDAKEITFVNNMIKCISDSPLMVNVLIEGETGTGKEVVARALHHNRHHDKQFFAVNCGLFRGETLGTELFGHIKGAFTGAVKNKEGIIKSLDKAGGGTLFLDELHDMPADTQPALLRLLESWEYRPLGSNNIEKVQYKPLIISAMQPELSDELGTKFRNDLVNRLAEIRINTPPLTCNSPKGIESIVVCLLNKILEEFNGIETDRKKMVDKQNQVLEKLNYQEIAQHNWSGGNVRALRNYLKTCLITGDYSLPNSHPTPVQEKQDLPLFAQIPEIPKQIRTVKDIETSYIDYVVNKFPDINKSELTNLLGMSAPTLRKKQKKAGAKR